MTLLSAQAQAQTGSWGYHYLETIAGNINAHIPVSFRHRLASAILELDSSVKKRLDWLGFDLSKYRDYDSATVGVVLCVTATILLAVVIAITIAAMSGGNWRNPFNRSFWSRTPSYGPGGGGAPHVSDNDYSYVTGGDIHGHPQSRPAPADDGPDIIFLKHHKYKYTLEFPAYAMSDGALSVGQLRQRAAEVTRTPDPQRIKLLYKGKLLGEDWVQCKAEGMKQESEVLCVVSEVEPGESSEGEIHVPVQRTGTEMSAMTEEGGQGGRKRNRGKKGKKAKNKKEAPTPTQPPPPQPQAHSQQSKPAISTSASSLPAPAPNLNSFNTPFDKVNALATYFRTELLPPSEAYIASPPSEPKYRDFEHKKLTETIMAQVLLKADSIDHEGDQGVRSARKALINEAQETSRRLDQAAKS
ncbi:BAG family molecular chaperone regulator [Aspergillus chevalieri]|uniref:BAG domain-containing protein n=1 Tax=Aspergillus chevalieri TaxID=182096 RepID=A0A7R7ZIV3_ASPCH|nr:uncharacterized protein ACHE_11060S [Aspergillus chevalieri]BCR83658.1 hypothetical protein ACHE_11060S [Aspergillus chevalieri]